MQLDTEAVECKASGVSGELAQSWAASVGWKYSIEGYQPERPDNTVVDIFPALRSPAHPDDIPAEGLWEASIREGSQKAGGLPFDIFAPTERHILLADGSRHGRPEVFRWMLALTFGGVRFVGKSLTESAGLLGSNRKKAEVHCRGQKQS